MSRHIQLPEGWYAELLGQEPLVRLLIGEFGLDTLGLFYDSQTGRAVLGMGRELWDSKGATAAAIKRVKTLRGLLKVSGAWVPNMSAGDPFHVNSDGTRNMYATIQSTVYAKDTISIKVVSDGLEQPEETSKPYLERLDDLVMLDPDAMTVLRLLSTPDSDTWTGLYRVKEVIQATVGGIEKLVDKGWTSESQASRFSRTANSPHVSGEAARHGVFRAQPPSNSMTLEEGRAYLLMLAQAWFAERLAKFDHCAASQYPRQ